MILGPNDPRAVTGADLEAARRNTKRWEVFFGFPPQTAAEAAETEARLDAILDLIDYDGDAS